MDNSGIPKNRQIPKSLIADIDLEPYSKLADIKANIVKFVNNGENLFICSKYTGNGKTSWALKLLLKYFDEIWAGNGFRVRGVFVNVPTLLLQLKNFSHPLSEEYKHSLMEADLVVWDDIASVKLSDYDRGQPLLIIDQRIADEKANIYTGNLVSHEELSKSLGDRLASRIWNLSTRVEIKSKDWREA